MTVFALFAAIGVFLVVEALGPRRMRVRLLDEDTRPFAQRMMDTFFAPAAMRVMGVSRVNVEEHKVTLARRLARAGYPFATPEDVMGARLFNAVLFGVFGGLLCLIVGLASVAPLAMLGLAAFGWFTPDRTIAKAEQERVEQLILDASSSLDRLAIYIAAGNALPTAVRSLAEKPGGAWVAEFRKVASHYAVNGDFPEALEDTMQQSGRLPEVVRVLERLRAASEMGGGNTAENLRNMANDARIRIKLTLTERGYKNAVMMVIPAFFAIVAIALVLIGPGAVQMVSSLG
jgi:Flp pilus assembly protein TadB